MRPARPQSDRLLNRDSRGIVVLRTGFRDAVAVVDAGNGMVQQAGVGSGRIRPARGQSAAEYRHSGNRLNWFAALQGDEPQKASVGRFRDQDGVGHFTRDAAARPLAVKCIDAVTRQAGIDMKPASEVLKRLLGNSGYRLGVWFLKWPHATEYANTARPLSFWTGGVGQGSSQQAETALFQQHCGLDVRDVHAHRNMAHSRAAQRIETRVQRGSGSRTAVAKDVINPRHRKAEERGIP